MTNIVEKINKEFRNNCVSLDTIECMEVENIFDDEAERFFYEYFIDDDSDFKVEDIIDEALENAGRLIAMNVDREVFKIINEVANKTPFRGQQEAVKINSRSGSGEDLITALFEGRMEMAKRNLEKNEFFVMVSPEHYFNIIKDLKGLNNDYTSDMDLGSPKQISGFRIGFSNHCNNLATMYNNDVAMIVKEKDIEVKIEYDAEREGTLISCTLKARIGELNPTGLVIINKEEK